MRGICLLVCCVLGCGGEPVDVPSVEQVGGAPVGLPEGGTGGDLNVGGEPSESGQAGTEGGRAGSAQAGSGGTAAGRAGASGGAGKGGASGAAGRAGSAGMAGRAGTGGGSAGTATAGTGGDACIPMPESVACGNRMCGDVDAGCGVTYDCGGACFYDTQYCTDEGRCEIMPECQCEEKTCGVLLDCPVHVTCGESEGACADGEFCSAEQQCLDPNGIDGCAPVERGCCSTHEEPACRTTFPDTCVFHWYIVDRREEGCGICRSLDDTIYRCGPGF